MWDDECCACAVQFVRINPSTKEDTKNRIEEWEEHEAHCSSRRVRDPIDDASSSWIAGIQIVDRLANYPLSSHLSMSGEGTYILTFNISHISSNLCPFVTL